MKAGGRKKLAAVIACAGSMLLAFTSALSPLTSVAFAAAPSEFDKTDVLSDLRSSTIDGEAFALENYAFDERKPTTVLYLAEYCYSFSEAKQGDYGLYLYVWNPQGLEFDESSTQNAVQLSYGDFDATGYEKYAIRCTSVSTEPNYERLFYKFKVEIPEDATRVMLQTLNSSERKYHVSGVELLLSGNTEPKEYPVNKVFKYSGYAKGYGANPTENTLTYSSRFGEALDIERQGGLHQTFYRPDGSNGVNRYTQDTLQTVYFSVPNKYFEEDYGLSNVRMEWLKAQTAWGLVTGNRAVYEALSQWIGVKQFGYYEKETWMNYSSANGQPLPVQYAFEAPLAGKFNGITNNSIDADNLNYLPILLPSNNWHTNSADDYVLAWEDFHKYLQEYHSKYDFDKTYYDPDYTPPHLAGQTVQKGGNVIYKTPYGGELVTADGVTYEYSRALFQWVATHKTKIDISAGDEYSLTSKKIGKQWWDGLFGLDGEYEISSTTFDNIEAIHIVKEEDFGAMQTITCSNLYIDYNDYEEFKAFYDEAKKRDERVVLIRYDVGTYQAAEGKEGIPYSNASGVLTGYNEGDTNCRAFNMSVYLGLDVIHLEFDNGEKSFVIPVISSPIVGGSDGTPALDLTTDGVLPWWVWCAAAGVILTLGLVIAVMAEKEARK